MRFFNEAWEEYLRLWKAVLPSWARSRVKKRYVKVILAVTLVQLVLYATLFLNL